MQSSRESQAEGENNGLQLNGKFNISAVRIPVLTTISVSYRCCEQQPPLQFAGGTRDAQPSSSPAPGTHGEPGQRDGKGHDLYKKG